MADYAVAIRNEFSLGIGSYADNILEGLGKLLEIFPIFRAQQATYFSKAARDISMGKVMVLEKILV